MAKETSILNEKNFVDEAYIAKLMESAKFKAYTFFGHVTVLAAEFENGYVIVESTGCVDPKNYDLNVGKQICREQIEHRLWQLVGWQAANEFASK